jgi:hypothetical protein
MAGSKLQQLWNLHVERMQVEQQQAPILKVATGKRKGVP